MKIVNPATNTVIKEVDEDTKSSVTEKYEMAKTAQKIWASQTMESRLAAVQKFSDLLAKNSEKLARDLSSEMGKPIQEALNEINGAQKRITFFLENSNKWLSENHVHTDGNTKEVLSFDALGVMRIFPPGIILF